MKNVYFIGIGGIGMSALARYFKFKGYAVSGYDKTPSDLTAQLAAEGIGVHYDDRPDLVPADVAETLVIWTPAIHELQELDFVREKGYRVVKRSLALGEVAKGQRCLAVSGTHGKTTTSTMIAHIFTESGEGCSAFLGGISRNYGTNLLVSDNDVVVAEADEFDRSFHQLFPEIAVITAIDADHLDIYGDYAHVLEAFQIFASQVSGTVIKKLGLPLEPGDTPAKLYTYSLDNPRADFYASGIRLQDDGHYIFDLNHPGGVIKDIRLGVLGWVNVENCVAASAICLLHGTTPDSIRAAAESFQGVRRRLDVHLNRPGLTYIDDYAHHPAELATAISSLKQVFPSRKLTGVFQPHLYTRTRDLAKGFAEALSLLDELILLDIYPAREEPIEGVTSDIIFRDVTCPAKTMLHKEELLGYLSGKDLDVLATFGAGDIDRLVQPITEMLGKR
jgi:UDP-N-acetylmuramate--alanine ligase